MTRSLIGISQSQTDWAGVWPGLILTVELDGTIRAANERAANYFGQSPDELAGEHWQAYVHPDEQAYLAAWLARAESPDDLGDAELRLRDADGTYSWHAVWVRSLKGQLEPRCLIVAVDIDGFRQSHEHMKWNEARFHFAERAADMGIWEWEIATNALYWSEGLQRVHHMGPGEFAGTFEAYIDTVHPEDRTYVVESIRTFIETGELVMEYRLPLPDGTTRWIAGRGQLVRDEHGDPVRAIGVGLDVTDRRRVEEQLREAVAAKDEFLGLLSHEIKNPLTSIVGMASILRRWGDRLDESARADTLDQLSYDAERLLEIIENLLVLARVPAERVETEPMLLQRLLARLTSDLRRRNEPRVIETNIDSDLPPVLAQGGYVEQVLRNLVSNALKYSPDTEPVRIVVAPERHGVATRVLDRGPGLGEEAAVFDQYFRERATADIAPGIGVGLAVCRRLVEIQGGEIWYCPREGGGAEFGFWLPAIWLDE